MYPNPSIPSLIRGVLLTGTILLAIAGAAQAGELDAGSVLGPSVDIPDESDLKEEGRRVVCRKYRCKVHSRRTVVRVRTPRRVRVRSYRRPRQVVVHHSPPTVVAAPEARPARVPGKFQSWLHAGGGFGSVAGSPGDNKTDPAARGVFGGGGYTKGFYAGGEVAITGTKTEPFDLTAAGFIGTAIPIPVFQPMLGVRVGGGHHLNSDGEFSPHLAVGPQLGFIARKPGERTGMRMMLDVGLDYGIEERRLSPELFVTFSAVF